MQDIPPIQIPLPSPHQIHTTIVAIQKTAVLAPQSLRPLASRTSSWIRERIDPMHGLEEDRENHEADDELEQHHASEESLLPSENKKSMEMSKMLFPELEELSRNGREKLRAFEEGKNMEMSRMIVPVLKEEAEFGEDEEWECVDVRRDCDLEDAMRDMEMQKPEKKQKAKASRYQRKKREIYPDIKSKAVDGQQGNLNAQTEVQFRDSTWPMKSGSSSIIAGSKYMDTPTVRIDPRIQEKATRDLADPISSDYLNMWPTMEDLRNGEEKARMDTSGAFRAKLSQEQKNRKEELLRKWKTKSEKDVCSRGTSDGYEDLVEETDIMDMITFKPTLEQAEENIWAGGNFLEQRSDTQKDENPPRPSDVRHRRKLKLKEVTSDTPRLKLRLSSYGKKNLEAKKETMQENEPMQKMGPAGHAAIWNSYINCNSNSSTRDQRKVRNLNQHREENSSEEDPPFAVKRRR